MLELGEETENEHQKIADMTNSLGFENVFFVGRYFSFVNTTKRQFNDFEELNICPKHYKHDLRCDVTTYLLNINVANLSDHCVPRDHSIALEKRVYHVQIFPFLTTRRPRTVNIT